MKRLMFGSSGIRGIVNKEITPRFALDFGLATGSIYSNVIIGHDPRISSKMMENAIIAGLLSTGCAVTKIGMVPTPTLAIASRDYDCGIMITASHNSAEYNGVKIFKKGKSFNPEEQKDIENILVTEEFKYSNWNRTGNLSVAENAIKQHSDIILNRIKKIDNGLKVVVDCGCGAACVITPYILKEMGCDVITINSQPDGRFPGRNPEPIEGNLSILKNTVKSSGADLGIAHDGDADRMMAVDNEGRYINGDKMLTFFAIREAKRAIAVPIDTSRVVADNLDGINISYTKVGDMYIAEELNRIDGDFGGEPSGAWIFPKISLCPDGIYATARLIELVGHEERLSEMIDSIPEYPIKRAAFLCSDKKKTMIGITNKLKKFSEIDETGEINTLDGIRIDLDDGWILIRPSGTEPKIRITVESKTRCDDLFAMVDNIVRKEII